jgi:hypothetical protein
MYIVTWISKRTSGLCEWATREETEAQARHHLLAAHGFQASMDSEAEDMNDLDAQADPFNPGYTMAGDRLPAA